MRLIELAEIANMEDGEVIPSVAGQLKFVNAPKTGNNEHGDWSMQRCVITDGKNDVRVLLKNRPALPVSAKGESVVIASAKSDKHGLQGCKIKRDTYEGKSQNEIHVTASAEFRSQDGRSANGDEREDSPPQRQPALKVDDITAARHHLMKAANLYLKCVDAAKYIDKTGFNINMSAEHFQACVATLFINADRKGLVEMMPDKPLQPPAKPQPASEPPDVVPGGEPPDEEW